MRHPRPHARHHIRHVSILPDRRPPVGRGIPGRGLRNGDGVVKRETLGPGSRTARSGHLEPFLRVMAGLCPALWLPSAAVFRKAPQKNGGCPPKPDPSAPTPPPRSLARFPI